MALRTWNIHPNQEIRKIFVDQIMEWFQTQSRKDTSKLDAFCRAFFEGNAEAVETQFNAYLAKNHQHPRHQRPEK